MNKSTLLLLVIIGLTVNLDAQPSQVGNMKGDMSISSVTEVCNRVAEWQVANHPLIYRSTLDWTNGAMFRGMIEWAKQSGDTSLLNYVRGIGEANSWNTCNIAINGRYHADDYCIGQSFIEMFRIFGNPLMKAPTEERVYWIANHPSDAPMLKTDPVGTNERWSWCDALFMAPPVFAALYRETGEKVYADFLEREYRVCVDSLYDRNEHLFYRDCKYKSMRERNGRKVFWGRGNGWVLAGIPLILENLPANYPARHYYESLFKELAEAVIECQDRNGSWHASMLDPDTYKVPENSASAFFCFGLAWGLNNGLLSGKRYEKALEKGWRAVVSYVFDDGKLGYVQPIGHEPISVTIDQTENYGTGALLFAGSEICKYLGQPAAIVLDYEK